MLVLSKIYGSKQCSGGKTEGLADVTMWLGLHEAKKRKNIFSTELQNHIKKYKSRFIEHQLSAKKNEKRTSFVLGGAAWKGSLLAVVQLSLRQQKSLLLKKITHKNMSLWQHAAKITGSVLIYY